MVYTRKTPLVALFLCFFINCAKAQFTDTTQHHISFNTSGSINRSNDGNTYLLNNGLNYNIRKQDYGLDFNNAWIYGRQNSSLTNNDYTTLFDFDLHKTFPHFFYWGLVTYTTSYSLKINNQFQAGGGVAYSIIDDNQIKKNYLRISDGILYDQSDLILSNDIRDVYHTYRNSVRLSYRFTYKDILVFSGSHYLQNSFDRGYDYIIRSNSNLTFKLNKWLGLTAAMVYNRQNRTQSENLLFTYGLTLEKYY